MIEFSSVQIETWLIDLIRNSKSDFGSEHHLWTWHEIEHYILKLWLQCFLINKIEIDFFICGDLKSYVSFNEVNLPSDIIEPLILNPPIILFFVLFE
jgi:hypothetical protein